MESSQINIYSIFRPSSPFHHMSSTYHAGIEPLETRIAPATVSHVYLVGAVGENDHEYKEPPGAPGTEADINFATPFFDTEAGVADPISAVVGTGNAGPDTFYVKLSKGDSMLIHTAVGYVPFITGPGGTDASGKPVPVSGNLVAFFVDKNGDNEVQPNELTGLALGKDVSVEINGDVDGDIVSNYNDKTFALGGATEPAGTAQDLLLNPIKSLIVNGDVNGSIVSGGEIKQLKVVGSVFQVLTGKAANGFTYDFNIRGTEPLPARPDGGDTLIVDPAPGVKGVNISNATIGSLDKAGASPADVLDPFIPVGKVEAGGGGAQGDGGSITNVTILNDTNGFQILAGAGGNGIVGKTGGGKGGNLSKIYVNGLDQNEGDDTSKNDLITIRAGDGGDALAGAGGKGGPGGAASDVYVGYELHDGKLEVSTNALQDEVLVRGGDGGDGKTGNTGGKLTNIYVVANPSKDVLLNVEHNIQIIAGNGGSNIDASNGGKAGAGGDINKVDAQNPPQDVLTSPTNDTTLSRIIIQGGNGGATVAGFGAGAKGGLVNDLHTVGFIVDIHGGNGSTGVSGGKGGDVKKVVIDEGFVVVRTFSAIIDAGAGGSGTVTKGADGGTIDGLIVRNADFTTFAVNQTPGAADGGNSFKGAGANGGSVKNFDVVDIDSNANPNPNHETTMMIRGGNGGLGGGGNGGNGGSFTGDNTIFATDANLTLTGGNGGNAGGKGNGGKGGDVTGFGFFGADTTGVLAPTVSVAGGNGGNGVDKGMGGLGGSLKDLSLNMRLNSQFGDPIRAVAINATAGNGGIAGAAGAAGGGGSISTFNAVAGLNAAAIGNGSTSTASVTAGDAGVGGVKAGNGGAITNASINALAAIAISAGDGRNGGTGGKIDGLSYANIVDAVPILGPAPTGPVTIASGLGSGFDKAAGKGGDINNVSGYIATTGLTTILAGAGGAGTTASASGGTISDINLFSGGGAGAELRIEAGDAGDAANAKKGAAGGSVHDVQIGNPFDPNDIDPNTIIRRIVAGDGGDVTIAKGVGGNGGDVKEIRVSHDIGLRTGAAFGYDAMGGIFAGAFGASGPGGKAAVSGSVTGISADAIASIAAGRPLNGTAITFRNLAQVVDAIVLNGNVASHTDATGAYTNLGGAHNSNGGFANLVGGVVNPAQAGVLYDNDPATLADQHPHANTFDLIVQGGAVDEYVDADLDGTFSFGDVTNASTDGFVAAVTFNNDSATPNNVRVEALLTFDPLTGKSVFIDLNNENGQKHS